MKTDFFGRNTVKEKLLALSKQSDNANVYTLYLRQSDKNFLSEYIALVKNVGIAYKVLDRHDFDRTYNKYAHQGVVLERQSTQSKADACQNQDYNIMEEETMISRLSSHSDQSIVLILDGIKDVGNLGAIIRSALLFNVDYCILPKDNSAAVNEAAAKRSAGAVFSEPIVYVTNVVRTIDKLKELGFWVYAADMNGERIDSIEFAKRSVIIMGEEGRGVRRLVRENADMIASIPTNDKLDSLNVSVSTAVILYEINRQFNRIQK